MDGYFSLKLKRKDLEDVNDDFSDFSLSSPARKIRRLDAELPPIIEEEECETPIAFEHTMLHEQSFVNDSSGGIKIEELPNVPSNEEKAIVLFKPLTLLQSAVPFQLHSVCQSSSYFGAQKKLFHLSSSYISYVVIDQVTWSSQPNSWRPADDEAAENNNSRWEKKKWALKMESSKGVNEAGGMSLSEGGVPSMAAAALRDSTTSSHNTSAPILKGFSEMRILYKQLLFTGYD
ncbi:hypothetical protein DH2020_039620 [Rehmannia glutinosa]|uniref:Uncharacterized protein n=1 Tax=Rehmannia glutinosa TaxID=99300 RepID=A0ABR0UVB0_REHGL